MIENAIATCTINNNTAKVIAMQEELTKKLLTSS